jgi:hypothetical protein
VGALASTACGVAPNAFVLVASRLVQGLAAALLVQADLFGLDFAGRCS